MLEAAALVSFWVPTFGIPTLGGGSILDGGLMAISFRSGSSRNDTRRLADFGSGIWFSMLSLLEELSEVLEPAGEELLTA